MFGNGRLRGLEERSPQRRGERRGERFILAVIGGILERRLGEGAAVARCVEFCCGDVAVMEAPFFRTAGILTNCERKSRKIGRVAICAG